MAPNLRFLLLLNHITGRLDRGVTLDAVARCAGQSRFQLHRQSQHVAGETLKQFTLRLQLERAAARLAVRGTTVRAVALGSGFRSH